MTSTTGCGCGGTCGGGSAGCGGGCGGHGPESGGFLRPRFFAGQLLCEEDLEQLSGYVTGKSRLRNRMLHGAGVACGLQVSCAPCGGGTVTVHPGYALDCCGNEIAVECPETLDVRALIRDMRARASTVDCGDPCPPGGPVRDPEHLYLYLVYTEQLVEPLAPYVTDEPCGPTACEPSRVREGYRFELRRTRPDPQETVRDRLLECLGDSGEFASVVAAHVLYGGFARALVTATATAADPATPRPDTELAAVKRFADDPRPPADPDGARELLDAVGAVAAGLARAKATDPAGRDQETAGFVDQASDLLGRAVEQARALSVTALLSDRARPFGEATLRMATWVAVAPADTALAESTVTVAAGHGVPVDRELLAAAGRGLAEVRDWLLRRVETGRPHTDCRLVEDTRSLLVTGSGGDGDPDGDDVRRLAASASAVGAMLARHLRECVCWALNPPCTPCPDAAVLLAGLDVADCAAVEICNAARTTLLTGPNLTYWLPPLAWVRERVEALCCGPTRGDDRPSDPGAGPSDPGASGPGVGAIGRLMFAPEPERPATSAGGRDTALLLLGQVLGEAVPDVDPAFAVLSLSPTVAGSRIAATATEDPAVRAAITGLSRAAVQDSVAERADAHRADAQQAVAEALTESRRGLRQQRNRTTELRKQLDTTRGELDATRAELDTLRLRVEALSAGGTP